MSKGELAKNLSRIQIYGLVMILALPDAALFIFLRQAYSVPLVTSICGGLVILQLVTYFQIKSDKQRAREGEWRVPESRLHSLELLGGWPASFVSQRRYRHKVSKKNYQLIFWLIVLLYQLLAVDFLFNGPLISYFISSFPR